MGHPQPNKNGKNNGIGDPDPLLDGFLEPVEGDPQSLVSFLRPWKRHRLVPNKETRCADFERFSNQASRPALEKLLPAADEYLVHDACRLWSHNADVIAIAMDVSPKEDCLKRQSDAKPKSMLCQLPLNLALQHKASLQVLQMLLQAAPQVLAMPDGPKLDQVTFTLALSELPQDTELLLWLLQMDPSVAYHENRLGSLPLHIAASKGKLIDVKVIQALVHLNPGALLQHNMIDETPADIARRTTNCSSKVLGYLTRNHKTLYTRRAAMNLKKSTRMQVQLKRMCKK